MCEVVNANNNRGNSLGNMDEYDGEGESVVKSVMKEFNSLKEKFKEEDGEHCKFLFNFCGIITFVPAPPFKGIERSSVLQECRVFQ